MAALAVGLALPAGAVRADDADCRVSGDLKTQIDRCTDFIANAKTKRDRGVAYLYRCQAHDMLGDSEKALEDCLTSADLNPDDSSIYNSLNIIYRNLKRYEDSIKAADKAIELNDREGAHFAGRAATYCKMGRFDLSYQDRLRSIELGYLDVSRVQKILKERSYYTGEIDGKLGAGTRGALKAWTDNGC